MEMKETYEAIVNGLTNVTSAVNVYGTYTSRFCPEIQFIRLDALKPENYPFNIKDNSIFLDFKLDLTNNSISVCNSGHIYLSPADKASDKYKYLCMKSMINVAVDMGNKKFRKSKFKTPEDAVNKINNYWEMVMSCVIKYTGGYPYKEGI